MILHVGGASTASVLVTVIVIFALIFALSFAVGAVPEGQRRFSTRWFGAWLRASLPRLAIAGSFAAFLFVGSSLSGGGDTTDSQPSPGASEPCAVSLGAIAGQPLTEDRVGAAVIAFHKTAELVRTGDVTGASAVFFGGAHNITHEIDGPLRDADPDLAIDFCKSVLEIEQQFATDADLTIIAAESEISAGLLEEAGRVLGITG